MIEQSTFGSIPQLDPFVMMNAAYIVAHCDRREWTQIHGDGHCGMHDDANENVKSSDVNGVKEAPYSSCSGMCFAKIKMNQDQPPSAFPKPSDQ